MDYSYRNASEGCSPATFFAGYMQKIMPTIAEKVQAVRLGVR